MIEPPVTHRVIEVPRHYVTGRLTWDGGCVTFCHCGLSFYAPDLAAADLRWSQYHAEKWAEGER